MPRKPEFKISSNHFKDLVILSLDKLSTNRNSVPWAEAREDLLEKISLSRFAFGFPKGKSSGRTNVDKWVYQAFSILLKEGLIQRTEERGSWLLTHEGAGRALEIQKENIDYSFFQPDNGVLPEKTKHKTTSVPRKEAPKEAPVQHLSVSIKWPTQDLTPDKYMEEILFRDSLCFGNYDHQNSECTGCPLQFKCSGELKKLLKEIESEIKNSASATRTIKKNSKKKPLNEANREIDRTLYPERKALLERNCPSCGKPIKKSDLIVWKRNYGEIHPECLRGRSVL